MTISWRAEARIKGSIRCSSWITGTMTLIVKRYPSILPPIGYALIRALGWTLRIRTLHAERVRTFWESGRGVIIAFWHSRQLMMPLCYGGDRKSTRLNSSHGYISYAVFCLKKKKKQLRRSE